MPATSEIGNGDMTTLYAIRERQRLWSRPGMWFNLSSLVNVLIVSTLAATGTFMSPLPTALVASTLAAAVGFGALLAVVKLPLFKRLSIA